MEVILTLAAIIAVIGIAARVIRPVPPELRKNKRKPGNVKRQGLVSVEKE